MLTNTRLFKIPSLDGVPPESQWGGIDMAAQNPFQGAFRHDDPLHNLWAWWQAEGAARIRVRVTSPNASGEYNRLLIGNMMQVLSDTQGIDFTKQDETTSVRMVQELAEVAQTWAEANARLNGHSLPNLQFFMLTNKLVLAASQMGFGDLDVQRVAQSLTPLQEQVDEASALQPVTDVETAAAAWNTCWSFTRPYLVEGVLDSAATQLRTPREVSVAAMDTRPLVDMLLDYGLVEATAPVQERVSPFGSWQAGPMRPCDLRLVAHQLEREMDDQGLDGDYARQDAATLLAEAIYTICAE